jgi:hypothetical protein
VGINDVRYISAKSAAHAERTAVTAIVFHDADLLGCWLSLDSICTLFGMGTRGQYKPNEVRSGVQVDCTMMAAVLSTIFHAANK